MKTCVLLFVMAFAYASAVKFTEDDGTLTCGANSMTVDFNYDKVADHKRPFRAYFEGESGAGCSVNKKKDDVGPLTLTSNYDSCGIKVAEDGKGNVVYSQAVNITYGSSNKFIKRHEHALRFEVSCVKPSSNKIALAGAGHFNVSSLKEQSIAKSEATEFDITLTKQTDNTYASQDLAAQSKLGDQMYFKLEMNTVVDNLKMAPTTCYASNAKDSKDTYPLIQNGCPNAEDGTVKIDETNNKKTFTWSAEAFKFFGPSDAVYVTCDVVVCEENNKAAACQRCDTGAPPRRRRALALSMASKIRTASISSSIFSIA